MCSETNFRINFQPQNLDPSSKVRTTYLASRPETVFSLADHEDNLDGNGAFVGNEMGLFLENCCGYFKKCGHYYLIR